MVVLAGPVLNRWWILLGMGWVSMRAKTSLKHDEEAPGGWTKGGVWGGVATATLSLFSRQS
jgi:hypothetical protein